MRRATPVEPGHLPRRGPGPGHHPRGPFLFLAYSGRPRSKCSERTAAEQTAIAYTPPCGVRRSQADAEAPTTLAGSLSGPFRYQSPDEDSARWLDFPFRVGDIVISSRSKTGTTWVQMICALLIFQTPQLPAPLAQLRHGWII